MNNKLEPRYQNILVLLNSSALELHRQSIFEYLTASIEDINIEFASSFEGIRNIEQVDIIIASTLPWLSDVFASAKRLKWVHFLSAGVENIWEMEYDIDITRIRASKSSGIHAIPIAEYVIGGMLYITKSFGHFRHQQEKREWKRMWLEELNGKCVGILGLGSIGKEIAMRAKQFGMSVIGTVSTPRHINYVDEVYSPNRIDSVLQVADFVVVTVPLTPLTKHCLTYERLKLMKSNAYLINISRGAVIKESALVRVLQEQLIGGAILDVFEEEPLSKESELWSLKNVLLTPHVSGTTPNYMTRALSIFCDNYHSLIRESRLVTPVDYNSRY